MPDELNQQPQQTQVTQQPEPAPAQEMPFNEASIETMTKPELEKFAATGEKPQRQRDEKGRFIQGEKPATPAPQPAAAPISAPTPTPPAAPAKQEEQWIEVPVEGAEKLRFKSHDELIKSFANAQAFIKKQQESINRFNAERGVQGNLQKSLKESQAKITELTDYISKLQAGANQIARGQQVTNPALAALQRSGQPQALQSLYDEITTIRSELAAEKAEQEKIRTELNETVTGLRQREAEAVANRNVQDLYREVKDLQKNHPEFITVTDFDKLDDIVSTYGTEAAQTMMSPSDWAQYQKVMDVVGLYKNDPEGNFDLSRQNFKSLEESLLIHSHRNGTLGKALAEAHKQGAKNFEQALSRGANSAPTLPNTVSSQAPAQMGNDEISEILSMDERKIKNNPELLAKFEAALRTLNIAPK